MTVGESVRFEYGILIPHFGSFASRKVILKDTQRIEAFGFDSVWVRDHLVFHPHDFEDQDKSFIDPMLVLAAVAATTERIKLATGSLIPHRNPVHAALLLAGLDFIAPGRVMAGWGIGTYDHEFDAAQMGGWDRREVLEEQVGIIRKLWEGRKVTHDGKYYKLDQVEIRPVPRAAIPIWYCGNSPAAVRRAVEYCDGWAPGRLPRRDFRKRMQRMTRLANEAGKPAPVAAVIPWVSPAASVEEALAPINMQELFHSAQNYTVPESGSFQTVDDLDGMLLAGPLDRIIEGVRAYQAEGAQHVVFDLRGRFEAWEDCLEILGQELLPALRKEDGLKIVAET